MHIIVESQPRPMLESMGAGISPTYDAGGGAKGMAPREGSAWSQGLCQECLLVFHIKKYGSTS